MSDPQDRAPNTEYRTPYTASTWQERIGRIDRRLIYALLFVVPLLPLVFRLPLPLYVTEDARSLYQVVEGLPPGKIVILTTNWEAGTLAENRPQNVALARD